MMASGHITSWGGHHLDATQLARKKQSNSRKRYEPGYFFIQIHTRSLIPKISDLTSQVVVFSIRTKQW